MPHSVDLFALLLVLLALSIWQMYRSMGHQDRHQDYMRHWLEVAQGAALDVDSESEQEVLSGREHLTGHLRGVWRGASVHLRCRLSGLVPQSIFVRTFRRKMLWRIPRPQTTLTVSLQGLPLPEGLLIMNRRTASSQLGPGRLVRARRAEDVDAFLSQPGLRGGLITALQRYPGLRIEPHQLVVELSETISEGLPQLLDDAVRLAERLQQAAERWWSPLVGELVRAADGTLSGVVSGVRVRLQLTGSEVVVAGDIDVPLPAGFSVQSGVSRGSLIGSPVLDAHVRHRGGPLAARMLCHAGVCGPLLGLLHPWPRSSVCSERVILRRSQGAPAELRMSVDDVVELVLALRQAAALVQAVSAAAGVRHQCHDPLAGHG